MAWLQTRKFDPSKGGSRAGYCLQNVRLGYEIPAIYPNAITAWQYTQQHKDRNVPPGLDVPLFYTYKEDGHINVRLANGTVWSDGDIYASIADYEARKEPVFLGWGESVNDVKVIKEGESMDAAYWEKKAKEYLAAAAEWEQKARARLAIIVQKDKEIEALKAQGEFIETKVYIKKVS